MSEASYSPIQSPSAERLLTAITGKQAKIGVVGLGYVGLPLVRLFWEGGFEVLGFDTDDAKVQTLASGGSYLKHIASGEVQAWNESGRFSATSQMSELSKADVILICVPTPLSSSRDPDLSFVENTAKQIANSLRPGQLVVLESTTYPGTTREIVLPILSESQLQLGSDFFLAYSPEREDPGNPHFLTADIPKVVGGVDGISLELAKAVYDQVVMRTVPVSSCEIAEASKIMENVYRSVNIAMVNELKILFDKLGINIWEVIAAARTKPFGFQAFYPGPGLGGHCIPIDPFYLSWLARRHEMPTRFIELAGEINTRMPQYVIDRVMHALNDFGKCLRGSRVLILGVAYKPNVDDPRESPAFKLMELLIAQGAEVTYNDPFIPRLPKMRSFDVPDLHSQPLSPELLAAQDCVLIATDHDDYDWSLVCQHAKLIVDTRNATADAIANHEGALPIAAIYRA